MGALKRRRILPPCVNIFLRSIHMRHLPVDSIAGIFAYFL